MKKHAFTTDERLHHTTEFQSVYRNGQKVVSRYFILFFLKSDREKSRRRLGLTITRSVGNAVERNRIKRQIREFFRKNKKNFPNGDCVFKARIKAGSAKNTELREDIERVLGRLRKQGDKRNA